MFYKIYILLLASLSISAFTAHAADIPTLAPPTVPATALSRIIDPDKSLLGIALDTSEEDVIAKMGTPTGTLKLSDTDTGMIYDNTCILIFSGKKLTGIRLDMQVLDYMLSEQYSKRTYVTGETWTLSNGIHMGTPLPEVQKIVGDKLTGDKWKKTFSTERSDVTLSFSQHPDQGDSDSAYRVHGLLVNRKGMAPKTTVTQITTDGETGSINAAVRKNADVIGIDSVFPGGPADKAGLKSGDLIIRIDGKPLSGLDFLNQIQLLQGKKNTEVSLTISRGNPKSEFEVKVKRDSYRDVMNQREAARITSQKPAEPSSAK